MKLFHKVGVQVNYIGVGINTNCNNPKLVEHLKEALVLSKHFIVRDKGSLSFIQNEIDKHFNSIFPDLIYLNHLTKSPHLLMIQKRK